MSTTTATDALPASVAEVLAPWADADRVPLPELARRAGIARKQRQEALDAGLVVPLGRAGKGGAYVISREDAERFASAALIAAAVGVALVVVLRILSGSGASVSATGVTIPLAMSP
jgi:hypothetical protein